MKKLSIYGLISAVALLLIGAASTTTSFFKSINVNGNADVSGTLSANSGVFSNAVTLNGSSISNWPSGSAVSDNWLASQTADSLLGGTAYVLRVVVTNDVTVAGTNAGRVTLGDTNLARQYGTIRAPDSFTTNWVIFLPGGLTNGFFHLKVTGTNGQIEFLDFIPGTNMVFVTNTVTGVISINSTASGGGGSGTGFPLGADVNGAGFSITNLANLTFGGTNLAQAIFDLATSDALKFSKLGDSTAFLYVSNYMDRATRTLSGTTPTLDLGVEGEQYLTLSGNTTVTVANAPSGAKTRTVLLNVLGNGTNTIAFAGATINWLSGQHSPPPATWITYRVKWTGVELQGATEAPMLLSELPLGTITTTSNATTTVGGIITLAGDLTGTSTSPALAATGPGATGPIGDATHVAAVTIDAKGRVTALSSVAISGGGGGSATNVVSGIGFTTDGEGVTLTTGTKGYITVPSGGTITGWSITAIGTSPTCTIDVWKIAAGGTALPTVSNTIMGTKPALATGNVVRSTSMSGWTTTYAAGDTFGFKIDSVSAATYITFVLETLQ